MADIKPLTSDYDEYLRDESRSTGEADSISFPQTEDDVRALLARLHATATPVTVQGGRTGLAAGAVPHGGHVMNLGRMNRCAGMRRGRSAATGRETYFLRVQPGVVLAQLRKDLEDRNMDTAGWNSESLAAWDAFAHDGQEFFFPTDPTETSATIGAMVACNASGARSYRYGAVRPHVSALRVVLSDGDAIALRRGTTFARGRSLDIPTEGGNVVHLDLPTYRMPQVKNASGYYADDDMDAVDLFVGSDGTLGVIAEVELELMPTPAVTWGVSCFFADEPSALDATALVRDAMGEVVALEFFDCDALDMLRRQKERGTAFAGLPEVPKAARCCLYAELACADEDRALDALYRLGALVERAGGSEDLTWVGRTAIDREQQRFFRHAIPESVNMLIDERRKANPAITKLGSDMAVPDSRLRDVMDLYRRTLREEGLQSAIWGHIGNNHLHVNVPPRNEDDYRRGKALFARWAREVTAMGGAVSAEHGVGKLKRDFLAVMYGERHVEEMARLKLQLDPQAMLGRGNLFDPALCSRDGAENATPANEKGPHA